MSAGRRSLPLILAAALLAGACSRRDTEPFFPIGMFAVHSPEALKTIKAEGFNAFQAYPREPAKLEPLAREAQRLGLRMLAHPHGLLDAGGPAPRWPKATWCCT